MIIDQLLEILPPPNQPQEGGSELDWGRITNIFCKSLPGDYMKFIELYGSGVIGNWLTVLNPFSVNQNLSLTAQFFYLLGSISQLKEEFPDTCPFPLLFEPGGLLPWGISIDGDIFCWLTSGVRGKLGVVVIGRHSDPEHFQMPLSQFLAGCISGTISSAAIPEGWQSSNVRFSTHEL